MVFYGKCGGNVGGVIRDVESKAEQFGALPEHFPVRDEDDARGEVLSGEEDAQVRAYPRRLSRSYR